MISCRQSGVYQQAMPLAERMVTVTEGAIGT
jgi:hypothetical protein